MLRSLEIRDLLLIDRLALDLAPGLTVLTGETGAGKSILLDALGLVLGWRSRTEVVRAGAGDGEAVAVFEIAPDHPAQAVLAEAGLPAAEELILRRLVQADGRKTAFVNDRRASAELLRGLGAALVELHGQRDAGLLDARVHRGMLDAFGGLDAGPVRAAWRARAAAREAVSAAEAELARAREEADWLALTAAELGRFAPEPGEDAALDTRRRLIQAAARIREDVARAGEALGEAGAEGLLTDATRWLGGVADRAEGRLDAALDALDRAQTELGEAQREVAAALEALEVDEGELERVEERLFALRALARKHNVLPDDLAALAEAMRDRVARMERGEADLGALEAAARAADGAYDAAAEALGVARRRAAAALEAAMAAELPPLKLERARFGVAIGAAAPGPEGRDAVAFEIATGPGLPPGPLGEVASGGELSRVLLALKVCLTGGGAGMTLVFDEIDRGVGGATADAVGRRLAALAASGQVIAVTHSPQVAALADHHWHVEKRVAGEVTTSSVSALAGPARIDEIARMLAGDTVTDAARGAARALLAG